MADTTQCETPGCNRQPIAKGRCRRCYGHMRRHDGSPPELGGPQLGDPSGHGVYGVFERQQDAALCHECGEWFASVASHARPAHGLTPAEYRRRHGLARRQPLVSLALSEEMSERAVSRVGSAAWRRLEARRDPTAASHARTPEAHRSAPLVLQQRQAQFAEMARAQRLPHLCKVCEKEIPDWRGADDARTTCSAGCKAESMRRGNQRAAATRLAQGRDLTEVERVRLVQLAGDALVGFVRGLYAGGVRQYTVAGALGMSQTSLCRLVPVGRRRG